MRCESVEVIPAEAGQAPVLANLLERYAHELSGLFALAPGPDGRYGYPMLPRYWQEAGRYPLLIHVDGSLAGFALVARGSHISGDTQVLDMAEFFILPEFRKRGAGAAAAREIWKRFPGAWEIRVLEANRSALAFWRTTVGSFVQPHGDAEWVDPKQRRWRVYSFVVAA